MALEWYYQSNTLLFLSKFGNTFVLPSITLVILLFKTVDIKGLQLYFKSITMVIPLFCSLFYQY
ncbi:hypothetical protein AVM71_16480 (plasmid) [Piscirickettsia salmonis]|nr:hypothetical protein AVM71_16480 [Piscirickettsia salmonis]